MKGTDGLRLAVAVFGGLDRRVGKGHVMGFDNSVDVCGAAVPNFDTVVVENFLKFAGGWEVLVNEFEE